MILETIEKENDIKKVAPENSESACRRDSTISDP